MELSLHVRMGRNGDMGLMLHFLQYFKGLGTGVGSSILTREQGKERSHTNLVVVKQKRNPASYKHYKDFHLLI